MRRSVRAWRGLDGPMRVGGFTGGIVEVARRVEEEGEEEEEEEAGRRRRDCCPHPPLVNQTGVDFALDSLDHFVSLKVQSGESPQCVEPISESEPVNRKMGNCAITGQSQSAREITREILGGKNWETIFPTVYWTLGNP